MWSHWGPESLCHHAYSICSDHSTSSCMLESLFVCHMHVAWLHVSEVYPLGLILCLIGQRLCCPGGGKRSLGPEGENGARPLGVQKGSMGMLYAQVAAYTCMYTCVTGPRDHVCARSRIFQTCECRLSQNGLLARCRNQKNGKPPLFLQGQRAAPGQHHPTWLQSGQAMGQGQTVFCSIPATATSTLRHGPL